MRILLLGRSEGLLLAADHVLNRGHTLAGVITSLANPEYRDGPADFQTLASRHGAAFLETDRLGPSELESIRDMGADIGVSMNWVTILRPSDLALLRHGVLNAHFGDLPRYRGNAAVNWAIVAGEPQVMLTIHRMVGGEVDSGEILAQHPIALGPTTTASEVLSEGYAMAGTLFEVAIRKATRPEISITVDGGGFRTYPRLPADGLIDWQASATDIDRLIRGTSRPYPGAYTYFRDELDDLRKLTIWAARVHALDTPDRGVPGHVINNDRATGESHVMTGRGILALQRVSLDAESKEFAPATQWRSIRMRLGLQLHDELFRLVRSVTDDS